MRKFSMPFLGIDPVHATINRKKHRLILDSNRFSSKDHVLNDGIPLIQNDEDEGQARELPDIVLAKDMAVDSESIFGTLLSLNSKMSGKQSIKAMSNVVDNKSTLRPYGFMDPATY